MNNEGGSFVIEISSLVLIMLYSLLWIMGIVFYSYDIISIQSDVSCYLNSSYFDEKINSEVELSKAISKVLLTTKVSKVKFTDEKISISLIYNDLYDDIFSLLSKKSVNSINFQIKAFNNKTEYIRGKKYQN